MHENLRNAFSIKPEDNHDTRPWQHLRSERRSLSFFSLYAKMNFEKIESENDFYLPKTFSFFLHEFKKGFLQYGISKFPSQIDMYFDTDSNLPVYILQISLSPLSSTMEAKNIPLSISENLSILNCTEPEYLANYKNNIEGIYSNSSLTKLYINTDFCIYVDIVYENSPEEEDLSINLVEIISQSNTLNQILGGRYNPKLGTVSSDRCRPVYAKLIP